MANVMRPLIQWPRWHRYCYYHRPALLYHSQASSSSSPPSSKWPGINRYHLLLIDSPISLSCYTQMRFRSHALRKLRNVPMPLDSAESDSDNDSSSDDASSSSKKSRNEKKREAKRAVKWAMELSDFSPPQIKRILKVASLDNDVYEAILLVKRFGRDVKEGKRRQYNYIGRLLREADADAELMDGLIQATKDSDEIKFRNLSGPALRSIEDNNKQVEETDDDESEVELTQDQTDLVTRWMDGLISRDVQLMNEIYSMQRVDFDRQELRRLVRKVQENPVASGEQVVETVTGATKSLNRFLRDIVKHLSVE